MKQDHMSETVVTTSKLSKEYVRDEFHVVALDAVDINIQKGRLCRADGAFRLGQIDAAASDRRDGQAERRRDPRAGLEPAPDERQANRALAQRAYRVHLPVVQPDSGV